MTAFAIQNPIVLLRRWWSDVVHSLAPTQAARDMVGYSLRTYIASMVALFIAFAIQLDSPVWAWLTVWIVSQPTPGMTLSKGIWRFIGTIGGSIMGVVLIALFAQTPELFVLALALLVGGCTVMTCLLTNFRAYATALTAYTAAIIASDSISAPDQVFFIAMARTAAILLGIACSLAITSIFAPHRSADKARAKLLVALKHAAERALYPWSGANEARLKLGRNLIAELIELNTIIEYAAAESANFRVQANHARSLIAHIFSLISARRALDAHLIRCGWPRHQGLQIYHGVILEFLEEMPARLDRGEMDDFLQGLQEVHQQLESVRPEDDTADSGELISERFVIDRIDDLLENLTAAIEEWRDIVENRWDKQPRLALNFHRDLRAAWINGLRAFLAVLATGAFWIGSAWTNGPGALVFVSVLLSIFASAPRPDKIGWAFFYASIPATVVGLLCKYLFVANGAGYEYLVVIMSLFLLPLGLVIAYPPWSVYGVAYSFVFLAEVAPTNPQTYDLAGSLNSGLSTIVGVLFGTLAYILIFPPDPGAARRYVTYRIRRGLEMISLLQPLPPTNSHWETRMYDRVIRLNDPQNPSGVPTDEWLDAGLGALNLGNEVLRLRHRLEVENLSVPARVAANRVIAAFARFLPEPKEVLPVVRSQIKAVTPLDPGPGRAERRGWARVLGTFQEMDHYLADHPRLTTMVPIH